MIKEKEIKISLLRQIYEELLNGNVGVGQTLLKVQYIASKTNMGNLEEWVRHEAGGYPENVPVPSYRIAPISYTVMLSDGFNDYSNYPIPPLVIEKYAGKKSTVYEFRDGLSVIDRSLKNSDEKGNFSIPSDNLMFLLHGKIYEGLNIVKINGRIDRGALFRIQENVREKILDFVLNLEKKVPESANISLDKTIKFTEDEQMMANQLTQNIIFNDVNEVNIGNMSQIIQKVKKGDKKSLVQALKEIGISSEKAQQLAKLAEQEKTEDNQKSLSKKTKGWIFKNIEIACNEAKRYLIFKAINQFFGSI
ncbi:MAG: hypothetical protein OXC02_03065 [Rhodobacteraceae bacterium]|nr:hypothetical protein [Paracoccaceae bacterium]